VAGSAAILNLILNFWWIPIWGIIGAAYATFAAYFLALVLSVLFGRRVFQVPVPWQDWLKIALACIPMTLVVGMVREFRGIKFLVIQVVCGLIVYVFAVMLMNIGNVRVKMFRRQI